jgi:hypothetical protein
VSLTNLTSAAVCPRRQVAVERAAQAPSRGPGCSSEMQREESGVSFFPALRFLLQGVWGKENNGSRQKRAERVSLFACVRPSFLSLGSFDFQTAGSCLLPAAACFLSGEASTSRRGRRGRSAGSFHSLPPFHNVSDATCALHSFFIAAKAQGRGRQGIKRDHQQAVKSHRLGVGTAGEEAPGAFRSWQPFT